MIRLIQKYSNLLLILIYAGGVLGFNIPALHQTFLTLVPWSLLFSLAILLINHTSWKPAFVIWLFLVFIYGYLVEWIGVYTGRLFGTYHYGASLGWKVDGIPLLIGVNWLILSYCTYDLSGRIFRASLLRIFSASLLMVLLDFLIEPVAIWLDFWQWKDNQVPMQNYLGWLLISMLLFTLTELAGLSWKNKSSPMLYLCLLIFFSALNFYARQ